MNCSPIYDNPVKHFLFSGAPIYASNNQTLVYHTLHLPTYPSYSATIDRPLMDEQLLPHENSPPCDLYPSLAPHGQIFNTLLTQVSQLNLGVFDEAIRASEYLQLAAYAVHNKSTSDEELVDVYELLEPRPQLAMASTSLPNISYLLWDTPLWHRPERPGVDSPTELRFISLIYKIVPIAFHKRSMNPALIRLVKSDHNIENIMRRVLLVGILGNYRHVRVRTGFQQGVSVVRLFTYQLNTTVAFTNWLRDNGLYALMFLREFYLYMVDSCPGMRKVFETKYEWDNLRSHVREACDKLRTSVREHTDPMHLFDSCDSARIVELQGKQVRHTWRPAENNFVDEMVANMRKIDGNLYVCPERRDPCINEEKVRKYVKAVFYERAQNSSLGSRVPMGYAWLSAIPEFKVSLSDLLNLQLVERLYTKLEKPSTLPRYLSKIAQEKRVTYEILRVFFTELKRFREIMIYRLPEDIRKEQEARVRAKYKSLEPRFTTWKVCAQCHDFKGVPLKIPPTAVVVSKQVYFENKRKRAIKPPKNRHCRLSRGINVINDLYFGPARCSNAHSCADEKIQQIREELDEYLTKTCREWEIDIESLRNFVVSRCIANSKAQPPRTSPVARIPSSIRTAIQSKIKRANSDEEAARQSVRCSKSELMSVNLLGCVLAIGKNLYVLCPTCCPPKPMRLYKCRWNGAIFTCGECDDAVCGQLKNYRRRNVLKCEVCHSYSPPEKFRHILASERDGSLRMMGLCYTCGARSQFPLDSSYIPSISCVRKHAISQKFRLRPASDCPL